MVGAGGSSEIPTDGIYQSVKLLLWANQIAQNKHDDDELELLDNVRPNKS